MIPPYQKILRYNKELTKIFNENNYKIVHSHINTLSVFPLKIAKKCGIPVRIAHSHSTTNKKEWKKNMLKQILRPFSKKYATNYMCCSELAGRWLFGNKEYNNGNVYILNNAIDVEKFSYNESIRIKKRKELNIDDNKLIIGHVGRFVEQKNHKFLIDIFNQVQLKHKNAILLLIGQGPLLNEIKDKVKKLNLEEKVMFLGQREDINELYQAMDIFIFPSLYEGLGMALVEAQYSGLPCIASDEIPKEADITKNIIFLNLNRDKSKWADSIFVCDNRKNNCKMINDDKFNIKSESKKLEKIYFDYISKIRK